MKSIPKMPNLIETAREMTFDAAQSAMVLRNSSKSPSDSQITRLLDSRNDREVLDGLRKVIAMMYRSQPCLLFFSSVVKNVASPNIEIKKLVYIYLLSYAEQEQSLALLSINTIQKSLSDSDPQVRALALKTMSGIRVPVIWKIVSLAIKKGLGDMSPLVRSAAALAIPKCFRLDPDVLPELQSYLSILLGDKQCSVAGAAVKAFMEVCPDQIDLIHKHYRGLVRSINNMDEWSQLATLKLMIKYSRKCFPKITRQATRKTEKNEDYSGECEQDLTEDVELVHILHPDLEFLLESIKPLLSSKNSAVIIAVCRCYINLGTQEYIDASIGPLIATLRGPRDIQQMALYNIVTVCITMPKPFVKHLAHFLIHTIDPPQIWELKLELLTLIFPYCNIFNKNLILNELEHFSLGTSDDDLTRKAVQAIGRCAQCDTKSSKICMQILLSKANSLDHSLVEESIMVIRHLIQNDPSSHTKTVVRLAKHLDSTLNPKVRASIIWLVGEFSGIDHGNNVAADFLRILTKGFANEAETTKLQIVLLAAKVYLHYLNRVKYHDPDLHSNYVSTNQSQQDDGSLMEVNSRTTSTFDSKHPIVLLWNHIILLARYDTSYDLRDRTRLYTALLADPTSTQLASLMLLAPKPVPRIPSPSEYRKNFLLGSASLIIGADGGLHGVQGYEVLPDWVDLGNEPSQSLRDEYHLKQDYDSDKMMPAGDRLGNSKKDLQFKPLLGENGFYSTKDRKKTLDCWLAEGENEQGFSEFENGEKDNELEDDIDDSEEEEEDASEEEDSEASSGRISEDESKSNTNNEKVYSGFFRNS